MQLSFAAVEMTLMAVASFALSLPLLPMSGGDTAVGGPGPMLSTCPL